MPDITRRTFLFLTGGTGAAVAAEPHRQFVNKLIPWVVPPENILPGEWVFFATTCRECPAGCGMVLRHRDGRVCKAEGNPIHPVNQGGLCPRGQSSLQGLYDPDRVKRVLRRTGEDTLEDSSWEAALAAIREKLEAGGRVALLSDLQTGALAEVMETFVRRFGSDRLLFYEAFNYSPLRSAHELLFGQNEIPLYLFEEADFLISFSADFLETWVSPVQFALQFSKMHSLEEEKMGRFAYVGPRLSMTAGSADEFIHVSAGKERWVALAMLHEILERGWARKDGENIRRASRQLGAEQAWKHAGIPREQITKLAREFAKAKRGVALAGPMGADGPIPRDTAVAASLLNFITGRMGEAVDFSRIHALGKTATEQQLESFVSSLTADDLLIIHNTNPVFSRNRLAEDLRRAGTIVYLANLPDETVEIADWVLPIDTPLESWGDYEPWSGIHSLLQPTMPRLYNSRMAGDILIAIADAAGRSLSRSGSGEPPENFAHWLALRWRDLHRESGAGESFDTFWREALRRGGYWAEPSAGSAPPLLQGELSFSPPTDEPVVASQVNLWVWPSIYFFDGHLANRAWLQEMPHPVSTIAWGSWVDLHPTKARELGVKEGEIVSVTTTAGTLELPVRVTAEVKESVAAIPIGQGHTASQLSVAQGIGGNPFQLLGGESEGTFVRATIRPTGRRDGPVYVSPTRHQYDREILQTVSMEKVKKNKPGDGEPLILPTPAGYDPDRDIYAAHDHKKHRWAMVIDLQRCIGCHACAVACYAENNIPVVGKYQVADGLEMAWLRVPPYRLPEHPSRIAWLPLPCQHCDAAPCEPVCPVYAAVHSEEGLNAQIYNRCIGTRYCSNNCPYKVRRFNWYNIKWMPPLDMQLNPEVTVRSRGVMEKCTFCVQRIRHAEYQARLENREVRDGEVQPACVQSCPARVFAFGDLNNRESEVHWIFHNHPRRYQVLKELNTKPAVAYLKKIVRGEA